MSEDNTTTTTNGDDDDKQKLGATITYDSQHALDAAKAYKNQIANQLKTKLKGRPYTAPEQRRNEIGTRLTQSGLGLRALPQDFTSSYPAGTSSLGGTSSSGGTTTDPFLKKSGSNYSGWHHASPVDMSQKKADGTDRTDSEWLEGAYQSLLGRPSDLLGKRAWLDVLASGTSREQVVADMQRSPEYRNVFIDQAYRNLLGRAPNVEGTNYWSKALEGGQSFDSVIANIKRSEEYGNKQQDEMRDSLMAKTDSQAMREIYQDRISSLGRQWQDANAAVQGEYGTGPDYSSLFATDDGIYQQDPDASGLASVNYLANVKDPDPGMWAKALGTAGKQALANVDINTLVDNFVNSYLS